MRLLGEEPRNPYTRVSEVRRKREVTVTGPHAPGSLSHDLVDSDNALRWFHPFCRRRKPRLVEGSDLPAWSTSQLTSPAPLCPQGTLGAVVGNVYEAAVFVPNKVFSGF